MGSNLSTGEKILKIDDLLGRKGQELHLASPNNSAAKFLVSIRTLNEKLIHFTQNYKNADYILELKPSLLDPISVNLKEVMVLLNEIILDLDVMIKDKKSKIDGKLDYIFEKFLIKKGTLGENKSKTYLGFVETLKEQASVAFRPILEELYKEPLLTLDIITLRNNSGELPKLTTSLVNKVHETLKRIEGNIGVFVRSVEDIYSLWDSFFKLGIVIEFEEICREYKKLDEDATELTKAIKKDLKKESLQYFIEKQKEQGSAAAINPKQLKDKFGEKQAQLLILLIRLHNFHVDFNRVKIELKDHSPGAIEKSRSVLANLGLLDKYFKLSDELVKIASARNPKNKLGGGYYGDDYGGDYGGDYGSHSDYNGAITDAINTANIGVSTQGAFGNQSFLMWSLIIVIGLIIIIMFLLWSSGVVAKKNSENIIEPNQMYVR